MPINKRRRTRQPAADAVTRRLRFAGLLLWRSWRHTIPRVDGVRKPARLYCQALRWRFFYP